MGYKEFGNLLITGCTSTINKVTDWEKMPESKIRTKEKRPKMEGNLGGF
jgi:hypothetical protein